MESLNGLLNVLVYWGQSNYALQLASPSFYLATAGRTTTRQLPDRTEGATQSPPLEAIAEEHLRMECDVFGDEEINAEGGVSMGEACDGQELQAERYIWH